MSKFFNLTFAAGFLAFAAPAAFAQDATVYSGGDAAETSAVQAALNKDIYLRIAHVHAETIDGVVYLQGNAGSRVAAERAEDIARSVPHVGKIVDGLGDSQAS
jgi:osmotically-inducible protein OsmY